MKRIAILAATIAIFSCGAAQAALVSGSPTAPAGSPASPTPLFGTLIDFDDQPTGTAVGAADYAGQGVSSITNTLGPALGRYTSSQSGINYIGTGFGVNWNADILVHFSTLQAAVGIGIAGPTTLQFELLDASLNVLEGYSVQTTPVNTYYYINRLNNDVSFLRVAGNFVAIDDLQFSTRTVRQDGAIPEPATWAMMIMGFAGVGASLRSARRRQAVRYAA